MRGVAVIENIIATCKYCKIKFKAQSRKKEVCPPCYLEQKQIQSYNSLKNKKKKNDKNKFRKS